ncbi:Cytochrome c2 [Hyphomicrobiales bacterium]|nr:Cytochrome c2 [Hyphomicrobiales bacterium]CAH1667960.1 Cytochrome c2 [Hyphomicrobiales bacterium]
MRYAFPTVTLAFAAVVAALGTLGAAPAHAQDAAAGEAVFRKCRACHQVGEGARNLVGPRLNGIIGRPAAAVEGYTYSPALKEAGLTWDDANLKHWLQNPRDFLRGTKMIFSGLPKDADVDNLLTYLKSFDRDGKRVP